MTIFGAILGIALLGFGRKLFWLLIAVIGFIVGYILAGQIFESAGWIQILSGLLLGGAGALFALFLQKIAILVACFLAGGLVAARLLEILGLGNGNLSWIPFIIGGVFGTILISIMFEWGLIVLSSLVGSFLITQALIPASNSANLLFFILLGVGILIQAAMKRREKR